MPHVWVLTSQPSSCCRCVHVCMDACSTPIIILRCAQEGLANVCLVGSSTTLVRAKIEHSLPRKRGAAAAGYDKALDAFFAKV